MLCSFKERSYFVLLGREPISNPNRNLYPFKMALSSHKPLNRVLQKFLSSTFFEMQFSPSPFSLKFLFQGSSNLQQLIRAVWGNCWRALPALRHLWEQQVWQHSPAWDGKPSSVLLAQRAEKGLTWRVNDVRGWKGSALQGLSLLEHSARPLHF